MFLDNSLKPSLFAQSMLTKLTSWLLYEGILSFLAAVLEKATALLEYLNLFMKISRYLIK